MEPGSGAVRAMVGGRDYFGDRRFGRVNLATGAGGSGRQAGLEMTQRLVVRDGTTPGTVVGQSPPGGSAVRPGGAVALEVAVDRDGNGALGLTLVPDVLGLPAEAAMALLGKAGLHGRVTTACDPDADAAALRPGLVWKAAPGPGGQVALARPVELWANPSGCPPAPTTTTSPPGPTTTTTRP